MEFPREPHPAKRHALVTEAKAEGAVYTPKPLADFVSRQIASSAEEKIGEGSFRVLDPAIGHGELLVSFLERLPRQPREGIEVWGFETDPEALDIARKRIQRRFPDVSLRFEAGDFLQFVFDNFGPNDTGCFSHPDSPEAYDFIVANPPYVRAQIMGARQARSLSRRFGLSGRVDLYHAFILGIAQVLKSEGTAGIIVSNRFMTTRSGSAVRRALFDRLNVRHAWDLGDTKLFRAAVLPAVLLVQGKNGREREAPAFTSIYETSDPATQLAADPISALRAEGVVRIDDGRNFQVRHGKIDTNGAPDGVWRVATEAGDNWLSAVAERSWGTFRDIGKIRVGVKTCADKIFIRDDWQDMPRTERPELLRPLTTHHVARRFKPRSLDRPTRILYPHEVVEGRRRAVDLTQYPRSRAYLATRRLALESRRYVIEAGRQWYEIWVPQDPDSWSRPKLVFRDIADQPTFWIDLEGSVVNGDCYWLVVENPANLDLLWLAAAVANSTFIERFYDLRFHNKLYAGRRRFITQYVENFPLPDPRGSLGESIIAKAKRIYRVESSTPNGRHQKELNAMVWKAFTGRASG